MRARIILKCAEGRDNINVADELGVVQQTVGKWRKRFVERRLDGLLSGPRPGAPRRILDEQIEAVPTRTLKNQPRGATQWSTPSMAREMGMSQTAISRICRAFGLQPRVIRASICTLRRRDRPG